MTHYANTHTTACSTHTYCTLPVGGQAGVAYLISFNSNTLQLPLSAFHSAAPVTALVTGEGKVTAAGDTPSHPPKHSCSLWAPGYSTGWVCAKIIKPTLDDSSINVQQPICPFHLSVSPLHWCSQRPFKPLKASPKRAKLQRSFIHVAVWPWILTLSVYDWAPYIFGLRTNQKPAAEKNIMFESRLFGSFPHRKRFLSCRLSWMILLTNSSSPPSAMISVTPPVFTELGGGRREFLEFTPWREQQDRQRSR